MTRSFWAPEAPLWATVDVDDAPERLRRAMPDEKAFGYELTLIKQGAFSKAVRILLGFDARSRADADEKAEKTRDALLKALASCKTDQTRRGVAALHVYLCDALRPTESGYKAQGVPAFFGRQHDPIRRSDCGKWPRYLAKALQGGIAAALGVCVATVYRYWSVLVQHGVWKAWRPPRTAPDAQLIKSGAQVYTQRVIVGGTPRPILAGLPLRRESRPAKRPEVADGVPYRVSDRIEAEAYIDGMHIPF